MAKMCPDYKLHLKGLGKCRGGKGKCECPKNTDVYCQIIPKRKSKVRRVKAWAFVFMGKNGLVQIDAYSDLNISHKGLRPCTILIDEKYLKEAK